MHHALTKSASDAHPRPAAFRPRGDEPTRPGGDGGVARTRVEGGWVVARPGVQPGEGRYVQLSFVYDPEG